MGQAGYWWPERSLGNWVHRPTFRNSNFKLGGGRGSSIDWGVVYIRVMWIREHIIIGVPVCEKFISGPGFLCLKEWAFHFVHIFLGVLKSLSHHHNGDDLGGGAIDGALITRFLLPPLVG